MTREEQFKEYLKVRNIPIDSLEANSIMEGIEWADENPQMRKDYELLFLLKKQELIKKACEWLKNELMDNRDNFGYSVVSTFDTITLNEFVEEFRKAMEE